MVIKAQALLDVERRKIDRSIFVDQEIYQQELEKIFTRAWLWIGHESLVPNPNDFLTTYMGEDPVILTRDAKGQLHAMLNMCRHRGNRVVRADDGNAKNFMCTYHGWTYSSDGGKLVSVPGLQEAYYGELDVEHLGLIEVAQLDTYAGNVFATWDPDAPSLEDYLGDARWYMDRMLNRVDGGMEFTGPLKWVIPTNWKFPGDNFAGDGYHTQITHRSVGIARARVLGQPTPPQSWGRRGSHNVAVGGHGLIASGSQTGQQVTQLTALSTYQEEVKPEIELHLGSYRAQHFSGLIGTFFPNMTLHSGPSSLRLWLPRGPLKTEVWSYVAYPKSAPDAAKARYRFESIKSFGASGMLEVDDMDNFNQCVRSGLSPIARRYLQELAQGLGHETTHDVEPGVINYGYNETPQRALYQRWAEFMDAESWADIPVYPPTATYEGTATFRG